MNIAIIGAGAAGCFAAINIKRRIPSASVTIYEGGTRPLAKVAVTGGGRCNLTNSFASVVDVPASTGCSPTTLNTEHLTLNTVYPRGHRLMKRLFHEFSHEDAFQWFEREGIRLVTQDDDCVFPVSQDAMEIVNMLLLRCRELGVRIKTSCRITSLEHRGDTYIIMCKDTEYTADKVIVATGGCPRMSGFDWLSSLSLEIVPPLPSLFSLNIKHSTLNTKESSSLTTLSGTVVEPVTASLAGTKFRTTGALLITHWGVSGPAVLKLSSVAARHLAEHNYTAPLSINWLGDAAESDVSTMLTEMALHNPAKQLQNIYPTALNSRLWLHLLTKAGLTPTARWSEMSRKETNKLINTLTNDHYEITGKNRHKEEFVTCGGVALSCLNPRTLECKQHPGLFFIGEVTDVDGITGGFNLQAAWTMAYVASQNI